MPAPTKRLPNRNRKRNFMRIVVKVGTSTLAHPGGLLNIRHTEDLVKVWSDIQNAGHQLIVVSSAATGLGVGKLQIEKPSDITTKQAAALKTASAF